MRLVVVGIVLVTCLLGSGSCGEVDCGYPEASNITQVISTIIVAGESVATPTIALNNHRIVCLAHSRQRDRYRAFSVIAEYTCTGNAGCPGEMVVEQFEAECVGKTWSTQVLGVTITPRTSPATGSFSTGLREDCSFCASQEVAREVEGSPLPAGDGSHCIVCDDLCSGEESFARRCFDSGSDSCCQVYLPNGTCSNACPDDGVYSISSDFNCLRDCPDNLGTVGNGRVEYSQVATGGEGFSPGTIATVACNDTYETDGYGAICSNAGTWNSTLPNCTVIECGEVPTLVNGKVSREPANTEVGAVATYECDTDYSFKDERNTRTCQNDKTWSNEDLECIKPDPVCAEGCNVCTEEDGKVSCTTCENSLELNADDNTCRKKSTGGGGNGPCGKDNIICIIIPIAILLAIILAVAVAAAVYAYYRWKHAPSTKLKEKDAEGINGVARDNPLYLDPTTVAEEVEG